MSTPLEEDPYLVSSWADLYVWSIKNGKREEFLRKMGAFVYFTNAPIRKELQLEALKREGELIHEKMLDELKKVRLRKENQKAVHVRKNESLERVRKSFV